jgi:hypothetical protein
MASSVWLVRLVRGPPFVLALIDVYTKVAVPPEVGLLPPGDDDLAGSGDRVSQVRRHVADRV